MYTYIYIHIYIYIYIYIYREREREAGMVVIIGATCGPLPITFELLFALEKLAVLVTYSTYQITVS